MYEAKHFRELVEVIREVAGKLYDAVWQAYLADGACYGETHEGMMRWLRERGEAERLRYEAEYILEHQQTVADLRRALGR